MKIYIKSGYQMLYMAAAIALLVIGIPAFFVRGGVGGVNIGSGVLMLWLAFWFRSHPVVQILADHVEVRMAPLASTLYVAFNELKRIERKGSKLIIHTSRNQGTVNLVMLAAEDQKKLEDTLRGKCRGE